MDIIKRLLLLILILTSFYNVKAQEMKFSEQEMKERRELLEQYKKEGGKNAEEVRTLLFGTSQFDRIEAIKFLCGYPDLPEEDEKAAVQLLYLLEKDSDSIIRSKIAACLFPFHKNPVVTQSLTKAINDSDNDVRLAAAGILLWKNPKHKEALNVCKQILLSPIATPEQKISAASELKDSQEPLARQYLVKAMLQDRSLKVREVIIVEMLMRRKDPQTYIVDVTTDPVIIDFCLVPLLEILKDGRLGDEEAGTLSIYALKKISDYLVGNELVVKELRVALETHNKGKDQRLKRWIVPEIEKLLNRIQKKEEK